MAESKSGHKAQGGSRGCKHCGGLLDPEGYCAERCDDTECSCCGGVLDNEDHCSEGCSDACPYCGASSNAASNQCEHLVETVEGDCVPDAFGFMPTPEECDELLELLDRARGSKSRTRAAASLRKRIEEVSPRFGGKLPELVEILGSGAESYERLEAIAEIVVEHGVECHIGSWTCDGGMGSGSGCDLFLKDGRLGVEKANAVLSALSSEFEAMRAMLQDALGEELT